MKNRLLVQHPDETRHELNNLISIALANVEGMIDGLMAPTTSRLEAVADALRSASKLLQRERNVTRKP
jgi:hypothetical protein